MISDEESLGNRNTSKSIDQNSDQTTKTTKFHEVAYYSNLFIQILLYINVYFAIIWSLSTLKIFYYQVSKNVNLYN